NEPLTSGPVEDREPRSGWPDRWCSTPRKPRSRPHTLSSCPWLSRILLLGAILNQNATRLLKICIHRNRCASLHEQRWLLKFPDQSIHVLHVLHPDFDVQTVLPCYPVTLKDFLLA